MISLKQIGGILITLGMLSGCASTPEVIVKREYKVVEIPSELFYCPQLKKYPNYKTLTEGQLASLLIELAKDNRQCKESMDSIKAYVAAAQSKFGAVPTK